jgi:hypothetical protein
MKVFTEMLLKRALRKGEFFPIPVKLILLFLLQLQFPAKASRSHIFFMRRDRGRKK